MGWDGDKMSYFGFESEQDFNHALDRYLTREEYYYNHPPIDEDEYQEIDEIELNNIEALRSKWRL